MTAVIHAFPNSAPADRLAAALHDAAAGRVSSVPFAARPGRDGGDELRVADLLIALEAEPWAEPMITTQHGLDRRGRVLVRLPSTSGVLSPCQARLAAAALVAEQAFAGCMGVAADLRVAADAAEASVPFRTDRPFRSGGRTLAGLALLITLAAATAVVPYH